MAYDVAASKAGEAATPRLVGPVEKADAQTADRSALAAERSGADDFLLLILASPSGAGKTTLCTRLRKEFPDLTYSISHTTRKPRTGEVADRDYHFVDQDTFRQLIATQSFAEWAEVHGNFYGTSIHEIENAKIAKKAGVLFDIDVQGARQIRARIPDVITVFILPPSLEVLAQRLRGRASDDEATVQRRLHNARVEIEHYGLFDYLIVNDDLDRAYDRLRAVLLAEGARRMRKAPLAEALLRSGRLM